MVIPIVHIFNFQSYYQEQHQKVGWHSFTHFSLLRLGKYPIQNEKMCYVVIYLIA